MLKREFLSCCLLYVETPTTFNPSNLFIIISSPITVFFLYSSSSFLLLRIYITPPPSPSSSGSTKAFFFFYSFLPFARGNCSPDNPRGFLSHKPHARSQTYDTDWKCQRLYAMIEATIVSRVQFAWTIWKIPLTNWTTVVWQYWKSAHTFTIQAA